MTDRELLELIAAQVGKLSQDVTEVKNRQGKVENIVTRIEQNHGQKLEALFDGYTQNNDRLDRIEKTLSSQEEFILKRVK
jgi:primosomal protein N''